MFYNNPELENQVDDFIESLSDIEYQYWLETDITDLEYMILEEQLTLKLLNGVIEKYDN